MSSVVGENDVDNGSNIMEGGGFELVKWVKLSIKIWVKF